MLMDIYVLSLPRLENRREHMKNQLAKFDLKAKWIDAVDREAFTGFPGEYSSSLSKKWLSGRDLGLGEIACLMSHLKAFQELIHSDNEWGIILEDDVLLHKNPMTILDGVPEDAKLVLGTVAGNIFRKIRSSNGHLNELEQVPYGAYCYAIHRKLAAQAIVHLRQTLHLPIDVYFRHAGFNNNGGFYQQYGMSEEGSIGHHSAIGDEGRMHDRHPSAWRPFAATNNCPKLIHQIWIGPNPVPTGIISWQKLNPRRIYKLWNEEDIVAIATDYGFGEVVQDYINRKLYPAAADIARYCILHRHGGFYADADSVCLRELDIETPFLVNESETYRPGLQCNGFLQVKAMCPIMADCLEALEGFQHPSDEGRVWANLGPGLITEIAKQHTIEKMPSGTFLPHHFKGPNPPVDRPISEHHWHSTYKS